MPDFTLKPGEKVRLTLHPKDADQLPAQIDASQTPPQWTPESSEILLTPTGSGLQCIVQAPAGFRGESDVTGTVDADLTTGQRLLSVTKRIAWVAGEAVTLEMSGEIFVE